MCETIRDLSMALSPFRDRFGVNVPEGTFLNNEVRLRAFRDRLRIDVHSCNARPGL